MKSIGLVKYKSWEKLESVFIQRSMVSITNTTALASPCCQITFSRQLCWQRSDCDDRADRHNDDNDNKSHAVCCTGVYVNDSPGQSVTMATPAACKRILDDKRF